MQIYSNTDGLSNTNAISTMQWLYDEAIVKSCIIFLANYLETKKWHVVIVKKGKTKIYCK